MVAAGGSGLPSGPYLCLTALRWLYDCIDRERRESVWPRLVLGARFAGIGGRNQSSEDRRRRRLCRASRWVACCRIRLQSRTPHSADRAMVQSSLFLSRSSAARKFFVILTESPTPGEITSKAYTSAVQTGLRTVHRVASVRAQAESQRTAWADASRATCRSSKRRGR